MPAAPRTDCGDVANDATNCGFCGHSCQGGTCSGGLCAPALVAQSPSRIDAFVTDTVDVFMIEEHAARACSVTTPTPDACREIVTGEQVGRRLGELSAEVPEWGDWGNWGGGGGGAGPKKDLVALPQLAPAAIALQNGRVFIADNQYEVLVACPASGSCAGAAMGLVKAEEGENDASFGRALALAPAAIVWSQGDAIRAAAIPAPGRVEGPIAKRKDGTTDQTAVIAAPGVSDLMWLSTSGLHYAPSPSAPPELFFSLAATDFSLDVERVYLATQSGLFRVSRKDKSPALAASGTFEHVAVDAKGVYATKIEGTRTKVIEARTGKALELAAVDGPIDALAVAGDHVYFMTRAGSGSQIHRVPR